MTQSKSSKGTERIGPQGIPSQSYALLGLKAGEADFDAIESAIAQSRLKLEEQSWRLGGELARKKLALLDEMAAVLTDPRQKQAFDAWLSEQPSPSKAARPIVADEDEDEEDEAPVSPSLASSVASPSATLTTPSAPKRKGVALPHLEKGQHWKLAVTVVGFIATIGLITQAILRIPTSFPKHRVPPPALKKSNMATARMAPAPTQPSIPGLTTSVPVLVPGLERVQDLSEPTLTGNLKMLVCVHPSETGGASDLYIAQRANISRPFFDLAPLKPCNTAAVEHSPSLSRDGLELIFLRDGRPFVTTRVSPQEKFPEPTPLVIKGPKGEEFETFQSLQILSDDLFLVLRHVPEDVKGSDANVFSLVSRVARGDPFEVISKISSWHPNIPNVFSADILREYAAGIEGVFIASRPGREGEFGKPGLIQALQRSKIGDVEGSFWISLKEDVMFFSSRGLPEEQADPKASRKATATPNSLQLWMVRFR